MKKKFTCLLVGLALLVSMLVPMTTAFAAPATSGSITYEQAKAQGDGGAFVSTTTGTFNDADSTYTSKSYNNGSNYTDNQYDRIDFGAKGNDGYTEFVLEMTLTLNIKNQWGNVRLYYNVWDNVDWGGNFVEFKYSEVAPITEIISVANFTKTSVEDEGTTTTYATQNVTGKFNFKAINLKLVSQYTDAQDTNAGYTTTLFIDGVKAITATGVKNNVGGFGITTWNGAYKIGFPISIKTTVSAEDLEESATPNPPVVDPDPPVVDPEVPMGGTINFSDAMNPATGSFVSNEWLANMKGHFDVAGQRYYTVGYYGSSVVTSQQYDGVTFGGRDNKYTDFVLTLNAKIALKNTWSDCKLWFRVYDNKAWLGEYIAFSYDENTQRETVSLCRYRSTDGVNGNTDTLATFTGKGIFVNSDIELKLIVQGERAAVAINGRKLFEVDNMGTNQGHFEMEFWDCSGVISFPININTTVTESDFVFTENMPVFPGINGGTTGGPVTVRFKDYVGGIIMYAIIIGAGIIIALAVVFIKKKFKLKIKG